LGLQEQMLYNSTIDGLLIFPVASEREGAQFTASFLKIPRILIR